MKPTTTCIPWGETLIRRSSPQQVAAAVGLGGCENDPEFHPDRPSLFCLGCHVPRRHERRVQPSGRQGHLGEGRSKCGRGRHGSCCWDSDENRRRDPWKQQHFRLWLWGQRINLMCVFRYLFSGDIEPSEDAPLSLWMVCRWSGLSSLSRAIMFHSCRRFRALRTFLTSLCNVPSTQRLCSCNKDKWDI